MRKNVFLGDIVALKVIKRFERIGELNALGLNHENVIKLIDVFFKENEAYAVVVMEYCEGSVTLQCLLNNNDYKPTLHRVLKMAIDISTGISYCHEKGVLHLDLKPSNVLVTPTNICKLCDFGNSFRIGQDRYEYKVMFTLNKKH